MIGSLGAIGALDTLGLEVPIVGFTSGAGGGGTLTGLTNDAGTEFLTADDGVTVLQPG